MQDILELSGKISRMAPDLRGVFSLSDLRNLFGITSRDAFYRRLKQLEQGGILSRFSKKFYVTPDFDPMVLSQRICVESYISFGNILAKNLLIGSVPKYRLLSVKTGPSRIYDNGTYRIEQLRITKSLFFGYENVEGINMAVPEKAVLDTLYFYKRGRKFSFDIYSDIDYASLDKVTLASFLKRYKNPKFVKFAEGITNA